MSTDIRHRGRPRGHKREQLDGWMQAQGDRFTMGQLSRSMGWPLATTNVTLQRAEQAGQVRRCGTVRTPDAKRPVALYEPAGRTEQVPLGQVMRAWVV